MVKINNQKECPICGEIYDGSDNFCSHHKPAVKLVFTKDLVRICPECGKKYLKEDNFCPYHKPAVRLVDIFKTPKIIDIKTNPNENYSFRDYSNHYTEINELLLQNNINKLKEFDFKQSQFLDIINNIIITYKSILDDLIEEYHIDFNSLSTLDKIILFSKSFVKTYYKEGGGDLGHFQFNEIYIDDRATHAIQITTVIHELSHFILAEILEQIISIILDTDKTDAVEAFVCYTLVKNSLNRLIDEYCAHTVEGRFAVLGYQDYGSYEENLSDFLEEYPEDLVKVANGIGNTFAKYIKGIMESFIDEKLREDIKEEYSKINDAPNYSKLKYETSEIFEWERFSKSIKLMIISNIDEVTDNPENMGKLKLYAIRFKENNGK